MEYGATIQIRTILVGRKETVVITILVGKFCHSYHKAHITSGLLHTNLAIIMALRYIERHNGDFIDDGK